MTTPDPSAPPTVAALDVALTGTIGGLSAAAVGAGVLAYNIVKGFGDRRFNVPSGSGDGPASFPYAWYQATSGGRAEPFGRGWTAGLFFTHTLRFKKKVPDKASRRAFHPGANVVAEMSHEDVCSIFPFKIEWLTWQYDLDLGDINMTTALTKARENLDAAFKAIFDSSSAYDGNLRNLHDAKKNAIATDSSVEEIERQFIRTKADYEKLRTNQKQTLKYARDRYHAYVAAYNKDMGKIAIMAGRLGMSDVKLTPLDDYLLVSRKTNVPVSIDSLIEIRGGLAPDTEHGSVLITLEWNESAPPYSGQWKGSFRLFANGDIEAADNKFVNRFELYRTRGGTKDGEPVKTMADLAKGGVLADYDDPAHADWIEVQENLLADRERKVLEAEHAFKEDATVKPRFPTKKKVADYRKEIAGRRNPGVDASKPTPASVLTGVSQALPSIQDLQELSVADNSESVGPGTTLSAPSGPNVRLPMYGDSYDDRPETTVPAKIESDADNVDIGAELTAHNKRVATACRTGSVDIVITQCNLKDGTVRFMLGTGFKFAVKDELSNLSLKGTYRLGGLKVRRRSGQAFDIVHLATLKAEFKDAGIETSIVSYLLAGGDA